MMRESEITMTNNDFLRRLRYALNLKDNVTVQIFKKGGLTVTKEDVVNYLKKDIDEGFKKLSNADLMSFLDGLITFKRGEKKEASPAPKIKITKNNIANTYTEIKANLSFFISLTITLNPDGFSCFFISAFSFNFFINTTYSILILGSTILKIISESKLPTNVKNP